jgi:glyoxylase-like metal-dependent hydrolase (beta-lactamase superfamily II)
MGADWHSPRMSAKPTCHGLDTLRDVSDFLEVAPRVWVAHYDWMHVNITLVGGTAGLVMVDTHGSERMARMVADDVRRLGAGPLTAIVNTHEHWDHTFGNLVMLEEFGTMPIHATEWAADHTQASAEEVFTRYRNQPDDPRAAEVLETRVRVAGHTFSSAVALDLGDRQVELIHPGRGHTAGDLVVNVPDARALIAGDLVEESDPTFYGEESFPFEWPQSLDLVLGLLPDDAVVVPGHGKVVDKAFVVDQRADLGVIAETIRDLAARGVPVAEALDGADWPYPKKVLADAVRCGYAQLPRGGRQLPLL